jgi:hypothetical protein
MTSRTKTLLAIAEFGVAGIALAMSPNYILALSILMIMGFALGWQFTFKKLFYLILVTSLIYSSVTYFLIPAHQIGFSQGMLGEFGIEGSYFPIAMILFNSLVIGAALLVGAIPGTLMNRQERAVS